VTQNGCESSITNGQRSYLNQVDREGLTIRSETFFLIYAQIWPFYSSIMNEDQLKEGLLAENICSIEQSSPNLF
jgi:hypothetical protein